MKQSKGRAHDNVANRAFFLNVEVTQSCINWTKLLGSCLCLSDRLKIRQYFNVPNVETVFEVISNMEFQQQEILFHLWNFHSVAGMCQGVW